MKKKSLNPKKGLIHQILILDNKKLEHSLLRKRKKEISEFFPSLEYVGWTEVKIRDLIKNSFEPEVLRGFDALNPYAYKSDLARLCILYIFGGWYIDFASEIVDLTPTQSDMIVFIDDFKNTNTSYGIANGVIYSQPRNAVFLDAIAVILDNVKNQYYGKNPLYPTGPIPLGKALATREYKLEILVGEFRNTTQGSQRSNYAYILPDGRVVVRRKRESGGELSLPGSNNYNHYWNSKEVYS